MHRYERNPVLAVWKLTPTASVGLRTCPQQVREDLKL